MAPSPTCDSSSITHLHDYPAFLQRRQSLLQSLPHVPGHISLQSIADLTTGIAPQSLPFQLPATTCSRGLAILSRIHMDVARIVCVVLLHPDCHRSTAALSNSLKCFPASQTMPQCGDLTLALVPSLSKYKSSPAYSPLSAFLVCQDFVWIYTFLSRVRDSCSQLVF